MNFTVVDRLGLLAGAATMIVLFGLAGCGGRVAGPAPVEQATPPVVEPEPPPEAPAEEPPALPGEPVKGVRVAFLVPLSGPDAPLGQALLDAAQLALFDLADDQFVLVPRDTGGTQDGGAAAADAAIAQGARLIIGPLFGAATPAVAERARAANINVLSFSNDRTIGGGGVFIMGLTPQQQVARVVGYARAQGIARFGALLPDSAYGFVIEDALLRATSEGAQVIGVERYPQSGDAAPAARRVTAYDARHAILVAQRRALEANNDDVSREALRRLRNVETAGDFPFEAILLAEFGNRLTAVAPLLPYFDLDVTQVRVLGTALWDDPRVRREAALHGAWFAAPPPEARADFVRRFRDTYGRDPPRLATIAYDATALAAVLARRPGGADFSQIALTTPAGFAGLDGLFRLLPDGSNERGLAVLEVRRDGFRTISPAPESFERPTE